MVRHRRQTIRNPESLKYSALRDQSQIDFSLPFARNTVIGSALEAKVSLNLLFCTITSFLTNRTRKRRRNSINFD